MKTSFHPIPALTGTIKKIVSARVPFERRETLLPLIDYIREKRNNNEAVRLHFICTHNSRRSQFAQIWAKVASKYYGVKIESYSGGVEVTELNERVLGSLKRSGFEVEVHGNLNPHHFVSFEKGGEAMDCFSKLYDDEVNPVKGFAAIMTCSDADENCPYIPGAEKRIPVRYDDPKEFDNTPLEEMRYDARSFQIATEMFYVFFQIKNSA